jgi:multiple sugar transport system permease protein
MSTFNHGRPPVLAGDSAAASTAPPGRRSDLSRAQARVGYLFVMPSFVLYLAFVLAPVLVTVYLSFTAYDPLAGATWVGLDNYHRFLTDDRSLQIFWNTLRFAIFAVTFNVGIGLLLALALNRAMPAFLLYLFRLAYFLPVIIAAAFVSIVWGYFYGDDLGIINYYLIRLGFTPVHWLTSSRTAMMSIIIMDVWKNTGFFMIIFIAALQGVPRAIMDAAIMDGASYWRRFFRIVLPYISPVVFFNIVYASIGALQVYESIVILTQGGPGDSTRSMSILIVEEAFGSFEIGYAASIAVIMTLVILAITALQLLASRRLVHH